MAVKDLMVKKVITVKPNTQVKEAVKLMNKHEIGCLVVEKKRKPVGIITERDVLTKIISQSKNPEQVKVSEIMSKPLIVGQVDMDIGDAARIMLKRNVKKLPIVSDGKLVGLITLTDVVRIDHAAHSLIKIIQQLKKEGWIPSKTMNKTIGVYIA